jgi:putative sugar O-methyltransferase
MRLTRILRRAAKQFFLLTTDGPSSLVDDLLNGVRVWSLRPNYSKVPIQNGSISGTDSNYMAITQLALSKEKVFRKFKSNREYREILEHVNREQGKIYLEVIQKYHTLDKPAIDYIKSDHCSPFRYSYSGLGRVAPSNLRYLKVALDLRALFGNLDNFVIAEIGIGYGGQYCAISSLSLPKQYYFYDLPQVMNLTGKYLELLGLNKGRVNFSDFRKENRELDLVVSNYAFSELDRKLQEIYLKNVVLHSKRGYMIYNDITGRAFDTILLEELVNYIPGAEILEEFPLTHPKNRLIVWGHNNSGQLVSGK